MQRVLGALIDSAAGVFTTTAGSALEGDRLPPDDHRPWRVPKTPWVMAQTWEHLLFAHWAVPRAMVERLVPAGFEIDTFDGSAWIGLTPFRVRQLRLRGLPAIPGLSDFHEVNLRTYVTVLGKPGVWFFSLDADTIVGVEAARAWYRLPYFHASIRFDPRGGTIGFTAVRTGAPGATLGVEYTPVAPVALAARGTLEWWLTERYCLYAADDGGAILRAEIHHVPWPLQRARAAIVDARLADADGVSIPGAPDLLHYARSLDVAVWRPAVVKPRRRRRAA